MSDHIEREIEEREAELELLKRKRNNSKRSNTRNSTSKGLNVKLLVFGLITFLVISIFFYIFIIYLPKANDTCKDIARTTFLISVEDRCEDLGEDAPCNLPKATGQSILDQEEKQIITCDSRYPLIFPFLQSPRNI